MNILVASNLATIPFVKHGFCGRNGGESSGNFASLNVGLSRGDDDEIVWRNRYKIADYFCISHQSIIMPKQIHSNAVAFVDDYVEVECDALITNKPGLLLGVGTADCAPILLCDERKGYVGVIHSGWRGAVSGIIENTFEKMASYGCDYIKCAVGPCIHVDSFEVGDDVASIVSSKYVSEKHFDLLMYVCDKLSQCGVIDIALVGSDTFKDNNYFSYRRQNGLCGVQFSGISIEE